MGSYKIAEYNLICYKLAYRQPSTHNYCTFAVTLTVLKNYTYRDVYLIVCTVSLIKLMVAHRVQLGQNSNDSFTKCATNLLLRLGLSLNQLQFLITTVATLHEAVIS